MSSYTRSSRSTLPRNFFTTRRTRRRPYRGYSYGRSRPSAYTRDSRYRVPLPREVETWWVKPDKPREDKPVIPEVPVVPAEPVVPEVTVEELATKLHVKGVDLHIEDNTVSHHTDMYECTDAREVDGETREAELVIRRGQTFKMTINFDRPYEIKKNDITFVFQLGEDEGEYAVVVETFKLDESKSDFSDKSSWAAVIDKKEETSLTVSVFIPASAPVGEWEFSIRTIVDVRNEEEDIIWEYNHNKEVIILFNPWCKEDLVYLEDETWMKEAVLNDSGALFYGTYKYIGGKKWYFGQFEDQVLEASLHLLRKVFTFDATPAMGNVIRVVRALSKIVNSNDDSGVLIGNWSGEYEGGTKPTSWVGSVKILKEYMESGFPVKYGQCWVYSGVLTTVCRSLGIPCRSVTNFESAHNSDNSHLSCDVISMKAFNGLWIEEKIDSVWNFHVWNEAWMARPDLTKREGGPGYDGWQVIDATPQETSDGVFQCGPSPLSAIKEGHLDVGSDTAFIFGEVNGDKVDWKLDPKTNILCQIKRVTNAIGKEISTHEPTGEPYTGDLRRERRNITDLYKYQEGTEKEREIVRRAEEMFRFANYTPGKPMSIIEAIELKISDKEFKLGSPMDFQITAMNTGDVARGVSLSLEVLYTTYRGVKTGSAVSKIVPDFHLEPGEEKSFSIDVDVETSIKRPQDGFNFQVVATGEVKESVTIVKETRLTRLIEPKISAEGPGTCKTGDVIDVVLTFTNPLPKPLTNCILIFEGSLKPVKPSTEKMEIGNIQPGETWTKTVKLTPNPRPRFREVRDVAISISSYELGTVNGDFYLKLK